MATTPTHNRSSLPSQETIPHVSSQTLSQPRLKPALAVGTTTGPCYLLTSAAEECLTKSDILFANRPQLLAGKYLGYNYTSLVFAPYGNHQGRLGEGANPPPAQGPSF
ncbi:hypothetical protein R6Q59_035683 [Mikania micrantha]